MVKLRKEQRCCNLMVLVVDKVGCNAGQERMETEEGGSDKAALIRGRIRLRKEPHRYPVI